MNALLDLITHQPEIDKIDLYAKGPYKAKYQLLINKCKNVALPLNRSYHFTEYSNNMDDIYENINKYNPNKKCKILIVFDDMIADMLSNKKFHLLVKELFIQSR